MKIKNLNIAQLIVDTQKQLAKEKLSPAFKALIHLLLLFIQDHFEKKAKNSRNSSIPPSQDPNRIKKKISSTKKPSPAEFSPLKSKSPRDFKAIIKS